MCLKTSAQGAPVCEVLTEPAKTITLKSEGCAPWVFANAGARGYYRVAYAPEVLRALAPRVAADLTPPERYALVADEWELMRAGRHSAQDYLTLVAAFGGEHTSDVLRQVTSRLATIHEDLTTPATAPKLEAFTRGLLRPLFNELGLVVPGSDPDDRKALRSVVVEALGTTGRDPDVVAQSKAALDRSLSGGAVLDPTLADAITTVAARHGDARLFDALTAAAERASSPEERYRALYALAEFREPGLIDLGLRRAVTPRLRSQDTAVYLARFFGNDAARERAWSFVKANWTPLEPKVRIVGGDTTLVRGLGAFCDARSRDDIVAFFKAHPLPGAARTLDQTVERIDNCIALRARQTPIVTDWLGRR